MAATDLAQRQDRDEDLPALPAHLQAAVDEQVEAILAEEELAGTCISEPISVQSPTQRSEARSHKSPRGHGRGKAFRKVPAQLSVADVVDGEPPSSLVITPAAAQPQDGCVAPLDTQQKQHSSPGKAELPSSSVAKGRNSACSDALTSSTGFELGAASPQAPSANPGSRSLLARHRYLRPAMGSLPRDGEGPSKLPAAKMPPHFQPTVSHPVWRPPTAGPCPPPDARSRPAQTGGRRCGNRGSILRNCSMSVCRQTCAANATDGFAGQLPRVAAPAAAARDRPPAPPPAMPSELPEFHGSRERRPFGMYRSDQTARTHGTSAKPASPKRSGATQKVPPGVPGRVPNKQEACPELNDTREHEAGFDEWRGHIAQSALHFARVCDVPPSILPKFGAFRLR